jgi:copper chaperone NosL
MFSYAAFRATVRNAGGRNGHVLLSRVLLALASGLLLLALALPLWRIELVAPQYPEGLGMRIHARTVVGATEHDLENINELNHYIGMKAIEPEEIPELQIIPWLIAGLAAFGAIGAVAGRKGITCAWLVAFIALGAVGMWDFWHWEYTYGHDLDLAHAIIKIPGMTYQPPLIGSKQLLNFTASSWPSSGALCIGAAFALGVISLLLEGDTAARVARVSSSSPVKGLAELQ